MQRAIRFPPDENRHAENKIQIAHAFTSRDARYPVVYPANAKDSS